MSEFKVTIDPEIVKQLEKKVSDCSAETIRRKVFLAIKSAIEADHMDSVKICTRFMPEHVALAMATELSQKLSDVHVCVDSNFVDGSTGVRQIILKAK